MQLQLTRKNMKITASKWKHKQVGWFYRKVLGLLEKFAQTHIATYDIKMECDIKKCVGKVR